MGGAGKAMNQVVLSVLAAVVLIGGALFASMRADRRRESRQQRLRAVVATGPSEDAPTLSLRRPLTRAGIRDLFLLSKFWLRLEAAFAAAGNRIGLPHLAVTGVAAAGMTVLFSKKIMAFNPALVVLLAIAAAVAAPMVLLRFLQSRYQNKFLDPFPDALDLMCRAVRAGLPVFEAMEVASREIIAPVGTELERTLEEMRIGVDIDEALQHTADRIRVPDFRFFVVALTLQRRTGGGLAETLSNLSRIIRRRKEIRVKARALTAESKASAAVLGMLPFAVGALLFLLNPGLMSVLFDDPRGRFMLGMALLSLAIGIAVMALIIRKTLRA
jgi:Flp pilus assembly protein TadB